MKTLNDYLAMSYRMEIVEDRNEGGFVVSFPELPGCIACGDTIESAVANAENAKKAWFEAAFESGVVIHEPDSLEEYSGQFKLRIPEKSASLTCRTFKERGHKYESILCLSFGKK